MTTLSLTFPYLAMNDVMKLVKAQNPANGRECVKIISQDFDNTCSMMLSLPLDLLPELSGPYYPAVLRRYPAHLSLPLRILRIKSRFDNKC